MKKRFKLLTTALIFLLACTILVACGEKVEEYDVKIDDIVTKLKDEIEFGKIAAPFDLEQVYGITKEQAEEIFEDYSFEDAAVTVQSDILSIVKVKDADKIEEGRKILEDRKALMSKSFENYLPDQFKKVEEAQIMEKGRYLALVVCKDNDKAEEIFNSFFDK